MTDKNPNGNEEESPPPKTKRHRRTKLEMEAARAAGQIPTKKTIRAARDVSMDNTPDSEPTKNTPYSERARNTNDPAKELMVTLVSAIAERNYLAEVQPLTNKINQSYREAVQAGKEFVRKVRNTGNLLHEWKAAVGHGNWIISFNQASFEMSLDTAENWMLLWEMTDEEIEGLTSVRQCLAKLKEKKKATVIDIGDNDDEGEGAESLARVFDDVVQTPEAASTESLRPDPETFIGELEAKVKVACLLYSRVELERSITSMLDEYYSRPASEWGASPAVSPE